jgi:hypothetical protein
VTTARAETTGGGQSLAERLLPNVIRAIAAIFVVFFTVGLISSATESDPPGLIRDMFAWGSIGDAEEMMLSAVYIVWGLFLWQTAKDPLRHRFFIDFTIAANAAHFLVMLVQGIVMEGEHTHLVGDVLLGWLLVGVLLAVWLPVRRQVAAPPRA